MKFLHTLGICAISALILTGCEDKKSAQQPQQGSSPARPEKVMPDFSRIAKPFIPFTQNDGFVLFNLATQANFDYNDRVEGDKLDGWSCRSHDNDQRNFAMKREKLFAGVPFATLDPYFEDVKACLGFKAATYPAGIAMAEFDVPELRAEPAYLYLLHSYVAGDAVADGIVAGRIHVIGKDGSEKTLDVLTGTDIHIQRREVFGDDLPNAKLATWWRSTHSQLNCICTSKFDLDMNGDAIAKIQLLASEDENAPAWMVEGVTISPKNVELLSIRGQWTLTENENWKKMQVPESGYVIPGSALDLSEMNICRPIEETGRVLINPQGQLVFENDTETPLRFMTSLSGLVLFTPEDNPFGNTPPQADTKEKAEARCQALLRHGFNMERIHGWEWSLCSGSTEPGVFNPDMLDKFDYYIYCLKKHGIYLNTDCAMANYLTAPSSQLNYCKSRIYFDPEAREIWRKGVENLFCHVNPYTGMRLIDDPMLVALIGYNEQEYAFEDPYDAELAKPFFQKFLAEKYKTIEALNAAWEGTEGAGNFVSFDAIPFYTDDAPRSTSAYGRDVACFIRATENEMQEFYIKNLRELGFKGAYCNYNVGKSLHYNVSHTYNDAIQVNTYHAHPSKWIVPGSALNQDGTAAGANDLFRWTAISKQARKPLIASEYQICFWQKHRYELAFSMGSYAALQQFSGLTPFAEATRYNPEWHLRPFLNANDPIHHANRILTFFLYKRGDVKSAEGLLRLMINPEAVYAEGRAADSISPILTRFALVTGFAGDVTRPHPPQNVGKPTKLPGSEDGPRIRGKHGRRNSYQAVFAVTDKPEGARHWPYILPDKGKLDPDKLVEHLKDECILEEDNRTSFADEIYESETGELYLDCKKELYAVNTPKFQGIAAPENTPWKMDDVNILANTTRGALAVVAIDGDKGIQEAQRLLLVYATNCYNDGTIFGDSRMFEIIKIRPSATILAEVGQFSLTINNANAPDLKAYALGLDGKRLAEIPLEVTEDGKLLVNVDTATLPCGPVVFFEITK